MNIALIAHDNKKELMVQFCIAYKRPLSKHALCAPASLGILISDATELEIQKFLLEPNGGDQQISARITYNEIDLVFYFRDPLSPQSYNGDINPIVRLCDMYNIPVATNLASAEALIHALDRGDLDWRDIVNPKSK